MKVLVTGGLGNLGSWITEHLVRSGFDVATFTAKDRKVLPGYSFTRIFGDIQDERDVKALFLENSWDAIVHLASVNEGNTEGYPKRALQINTLGTRNLLQAQADAAQTGCHFIYFSTFHIYGAKPAFGLHAAHGDEFAMAFVKFYEGGDVDIANTIPVCQQKGFSIDHILRTPDAAAGHRVQASIQKCYFPGFARIFVNAHLPCRKIDRYIALMQKIVGEKFLYGITFIAKENDKIIEAEMAVRFHDMPQDWPAAHFHHRLGQYARFLAEPRSEPTGQY